MTQLRIVSAAAVAMIAAAGWAQSTFDKDVVNLALLKIPAVTKELKLAADQTRRIAGIEKESATALEKLRHGTTPPTSAQLQGVSKASKAKIAAVLSPSQLKRLREITLQTLGPLAILDPVIQAKLSVSKTQKPMIAGLWKTYGPRLAAASQNKDPKKKQTDADIKKRMAAIDKIQKELADEIRSILTAAQLKQYRGLVGKPCPGLQMAARVPL